MQFTESAYTSEKLNLVVDKRQVGCLFQLVTQEDVKETLNEHIVWQCKLKELSIWDKDVDVIPLAPDK